MGMSPKGSCESPVTERNRNYRCESMESPFPTRAGRMSIKKSSAVAATDWASNL